jgi:hypothetical protein
MDSLRRKEVRRQSVHQTELEKAWKVLRLSPRTSYYLYFEHVLIGIEFLEKPNQHLRLRKPRKRRLIGHSDAHCKQLTSVCLLSRLGGDQQVLCDRSLTRSLLATRTLNTRFAEKSFPGSDAIRRKTKAVAAKNRTTTPDAKTGPVHRYVK